MGEDTGLTALLQVGGELLGGIPGDTDPGSIRRRLSVSVDNISPRVCGVRRAIGPLNGTTRQLNPEVDALEIVASHTGTRRRGIVLGHEGRCRVYFGLAHADGGGTWTRSAGSTGSLTKARLAKRYLAF